MSTMTGSPGAPGPAQGPGTPGDQGSAAAAGPLIKDVTTASFMADVIEASRTIPVIVDFWAPWCGPCKQLGPILEKLVTAAGGKVRLAKVDIDQNQALAGQLRIQSIPMVYAFFGGRPLDGFAGAIPESQVKAFIDNVIAAAGGTPGAGGPDLARMVVDARALLEKGDDGGALSLYSEVLQHDEKNVDALAGLARCYIASGETEAAQGLLDSLPESAANHPDAVAARAALELRAAGAALTGEAAALEARVAAEPADLQARYDLALAHFAANRREASVDQLIEIVRRKRDWNDSAARKQLVKMFEAWGPQDPLTIEGRQRLSAILFA
jgi:putative thioredoxin